MSNESSNELADRRCKPCDGGTDALQGDQITALLLALHEDWSLGDDGLKISRKFDFPAYIIAILEGDFGWLFEDLDNVPMYKDFVTSDAYRGWASFRRVSGAE